MTTPAAAARPEEPAGALAVLFGVRADLARAFWGHLATSAVERGLIGPREVPRLWQRHLLNCVAISAFIPDNATLADVGSGAGLPGVAIAIARPDVQVTLVEPLLRRVGWLTEVVADLGLENVEVVRARAEELRGQLLVDVATARAVAALPVLAGWCLPLVRPGGRLLALKGRTAEEELAASVDALRALGAVSWGIRTVGEDILAERTTVVEVIAGKAPASESSRRRRGSGSGAGPGEGPSTGDTSSAGTGAVARGGASIPGGDAAAERGSEERRPWLSRGREDRSGVSRESATGGSSPGSRRGRGRRR